MTSMRRLSRRLLRWERYADRVAFNQRIVQPWAWQPPTGYRRAARAVEAERERRFWEETSEIHLVGLPDDGPYEGYGPCFCLGCIGSGPCEHADSDEPQTYWPTYPATGEPPAEWRLP
jgi:hypothetical protein